MNEVEAIRHVQAREIRGLRTLVEKFQLPAVRAAVLITRDLSLAEEVVQGAFLRFYERAHNFDPKRPFAPYFMRMVVNDAIKAARRRDRTRSLDQPLGNGTVPLYELLPDPRPGPDKEVSARLLREEVWAALGRLSPRQRATIVRRYYLEMSEAEMADEMGIAPGTVKWHLHQARERLRKVFEAGN
jgi:RNA polymerase sigma-70 factor (ECF subfamily)